MEEETASQPETVTIEKTETAGVESIEEDTEYMEETRFEVKPSLWQRIKQSKIGRAISYVFKVRVVLQAPALPEGKGENT